MWGSLSTARNSQGKMMLWLSAGGGVSQSALVVKAAGEDLIRLLPNHEQTRSPSAGVVAGSRFSPAHAASWSRVSCSAAGRFHRAAGIGGAAVCGIPWGEFSLPVHTAEGAPAPELPLRSSSQSRLGGDTPPFSRGRHIGCSGRSGLVFNSRFWQVRRGAGSFRARALPSKDCLRKGGIGDVRYSAR